MTARRSSSRGMYLSRIFHTLLLQQPNLATKRMKYAG